MPKWTSYVGRLGTTRHRLIKLIAAGLFCTAAVLLPLRARSQTPAITPAVDIDEQKLERGGYTFAKVLAAGGDFFSTPFTPYDKDTNTGDGHGEGPDGPRSSMIAIFYREHPGYPFLRVNGLDSQSCYECHNSIGSDDAYQGAQIRRPFPVGGSAGAASNAFINPNFPQTVTDPATGLQNLTTFIRNPPMVFGTGYTQQIAEEMTRDLAIDVRVARAIAKNPNNPSHRATVNLKAKGEDFGQFTTTYTPGTSQVTGCANGELCGDYPAQLGVPDFTDDLSKLQHVECDLVVRPFQWKGVSSSIRHFVRDALDFHFSMQAEEKYGDRLDCDKDGKPGPQNEHQEMSIGNVSALTSFVVMTRPPEQVWPTNPVKRRNAKIGEKIFTGSYEPLKGDLTGQMCATCHVPNIVMDDPWVTIDNPGLPDFSKYPFNKVKDPCSILNAGLVSPVGTTQDLEVVKRINRRLSQVNIEGIVNRYIQQRKLNAVPETTTQQTQVDQIIDEVKRQVEQVKQHEIRAALGALKTAVTSGPGIQLNLTSPRLAAESGPPSLPAYLHGHVFPRLAPISAKDPRVTVPLMSDLKQHDMGTGLQDFKGQDQGSDVMGLCIPYRRFLTRPLWGVADTGPWLHDGRARTLKDAIMFHESPGSEANGIIDAFKKLPEKYQEDVVDFLLTLKLPAPGK